MLRGHSLRIAGTESPSLTCHSQRYYNCTSIACIGVATLLWNDLEAIKYRSNHWDKNSDNQDEGGSQRHGLVRNRKRHHTHSVPLQNSIRLKMSQVFEERAGSARSCRQNEWAFDGHEGC